MVFDNGTVDVVFDGKQLPCASIDFHAEMGKNGVDIPDVKLSLVPFPIDDKQTKPKDEICNKKN